MTRAEQWHTVLRVVAVVAPMGAVIGLVLGSFLGEGVRSVVAGGVVGLIIAIGMVTFEVTWVVGLTPRRWREAPFLVVLLTRSLTWLAIIVISITVPLLTIARVPPEDLADTTFLVSVLASFLAALVINFVGQVNRLLGRGVLVRLIAGRYHRPREEVRIFLLIDLRGSTQIAEQLGNLPFHGFLKRFIEDITASAVRFGAEVHRYVGDEVILTWDKRKGLEKGNCVNAVFAMTEAIELASDAYTADFGVVPRFWAGLHLGPVVTGEIGTVKHEIAYLGDTLNAAARIEQACRQFQRPFLASRDVIQAVELPNGVATESLGPIELRGLGSSVELLAVVNDAARR